MKFGLDERKIGSPRDPSLSLDQIFFGIKKRTLSYSVSKRATVFLIGSRKAVRHYRKLSVNENGADGATSKLALGSPQICHGPILRNGELTQNSIHSQRCPTASH